MYNSMLLLPKWVLNNKYPSVYDSESKTAIEQTARVYGAMNELIENYNTFVSELEKSITEHEKNTDESIEEFKTKVVNLQLKHIQSMDLKVKELYSHLKDNLGNVISGMVNDGTLEVELKTHFNNIFDSLETRVVALEQMEHQFIYDPETESINPVNIPIGE